MSSSDNIAAANGSRPVPGEQRRIALSITEGRTVRDLFYNGLLDMLCDAGYEVTVFTEAFTVPEFVKEWSRPGVDFQPLLPCDWSGWRSRSLRLRRRLSRLPSRVPMKLYSFWEERHFYPPPKAYLDWFRTNRPQLLLTTHAHMISERELLSAAHATGTPTLGVVRSWDNVHKGIYSRPRKVAVWNEINRQELVEMEGYDREDIYIVGSPQFDPYFAPDALWERQRLADHFGLDPSRPIILFASLGYFIPGFDETCWMDALLDLIDHDEIPGMPQVICRLHPWSRLEHFEGYASHPDVRLSYVDRYWPGLTWYMTRDDVVLMANVLHHSDVVITPGSTISLEAAIFDRPTLVPTFHPYQPERAEDYFNTWVFGKHFGRIEELDLIPIIRQLDEFGPAIRRCLEEPGWYLEGRARLVSDYVGETDGQATVRLADLALAFAAKKPPPAELGASDHAAMSLGSGRAASQTDSGEGQ